MKQLKTVLLFIFLIFQSGYSQKRQVKGDTVTYFKNSLDLGYSGAAKLPLGFHASYFAFYLGEKEAYLGGVIQYNFDINGFHHLNLLTYKNRIFYKKTNLNDNISYNFQDRKLNLKQLNNHFQNHQIKYSLHSVNNFGIGVGIDYLVNDNSQTGGHLSISKYFLKSNMNVSLSSSVFANQINYKIGMGKNWNFKNRLPIRNISLGLTYEEFMNYKDLYFRVSTSFY